MSVSTLPANGLTLRGIPSGIEDSKQGSTSAILLKLSDDVLRDVRKASSTQGGLQFITGHTPKIRLGKRTIDLTLSSEAFRHELFSASEASLDKMDFAGVLSHRAQLKSVEKRPSEGTDAALAALQNTLASYQQEKQAKAVNISSSIIAAPANRFKAAKELKQAQRRGLLGSQPASPSLSAAGTPRLGAAPTSAPATDSVVRTQAMRTPLIHLLAMKPMTREEITQKTRIPKDDLEEVLPKVGKQVDGKWQLTDRACKELDVYKFGYSSQDDRQAAIDNAIRAYDRMRLGKDEKIWQMLLPKEERGKGVVLSKLHLGAGAAGRGLTPNYGASPMLGGDASAEKGGVSASNTPRLGPSSSTPKTSSGALSKTLFAKDPKKARAAEEAKERKRKDREAAASTSDREGGKPVRKKQTTRTNNPKVKSAELVHSSSDEDSVSSGASKNKEMGATTNRLPKAPANDRKPLPNAASASKAKPTTASASTATSTTTKSAKPKTTTGTISKTSLSAKPSPSLPAKVTKPAAVGKSTPSSSQGRSQLSPQNRSSKPNVPSPLGAARARTTSDVSTVGSQRVRPGAETPKGLGITNGFRKRQDTVTSNDSTTSDRTHTESRKLNGNGNGIRKPTANGTNLSKAPMTNGSSQKADTGLKRKAVQSPDHSHENGAGVKHRKTESNSSQSQKSHSSSVGARSSIDHGRDRSDSASSITDTITYRQGVGIARQFRDVYYPQYAKLYDEQAAMEKRGEQVPREERQRLWQLHRRLEQMKREIKAASLREDED